MSNRTAVLFTAIFTLLVMAAQVIVGGLIGYVLVHFIRKVW
jgi:hypothetical protein